MQSKTAAWRARSGVYDAAVAFSCPGHVFSFAQARTLEPEPTTRTVPLLQHAGKTAAATHRRGAKTRARGVRACVFPASGRRCHYVVVVVSRAKTQNSARRREKVPSSSDENSTAPYKTRAGQIRGS
ncbi:hypothetical protein MTO96_013014 [Rhipicephalus appendiculatus]